MDHLEGKLFVDYLSDLKRERIRKKLEKERRERIAAQRTQGASRTSRARASARRGLALSDLQLLRVAFAGTPEFALPALAGAHRAPPWSGSSRRPDRPQGRGRKLTDGPVKSAALAARPAARSTRSRSRTKRGVRRSPPGRRTSWWWWPTA